jgi:hypothetical protein
LRVNLVLFWSLLFTALSTGGGLAHLYELPNKMRLNWQDYLTVQQICRGWALLGIVVFGSLALNFALTILLRGDGRVFPLALIAFLCMVATQIVFWVFTFPVNQATKNWTVVPADWLQLRSRWEYSHAAGAVLDVAALVSLFLVALARWK